MKNQELESILEQHGLRKTGIRLSVLQMFIDADKALSQQDIDNKMPETDRVTLYRTLRTFEEKGLVHHAVDNSNTTKYALCHANCDEGSHKDEHAHFHCRKCGNTFCVDDIELPPVPAQINRSQVEQVHIVFEGICTVCLK